MSLNESIVKDAALEWFFLRSASQNYGGQVGEQCRVAPTFIPAFSEREKGTEREVTRRLDPAIFSRTLAALSNHAFAGMPKLLTGELSVAALESRLEAVT
jgi:hypothetical protein